jgi:hypothetical protein
MSPSSRRPSWSSTSSGDPRTVVVVVVVVVVDMPRDDSLDSSSFFWLSRSLLALIGFNVFTYLDDITAWLGETFGAPFRSVARFLGYAAIDTAQSTVDVTAKGTKGAVDIAAGAATSGIDVLQQTIDQKGNQDQTQAQTQDQDQAMSSNAGLQRALSHAKKQPPQPDDATSRTQRTGKAGYCYIGEDRGFRSCVRVGEEDTCMSGDIFPTHAICVNPRLRK